MIAAIILLIRSENSAGLEPGRDGQITDCLQSRLGLLDDFEYIGATFSVDLLAEGIM